MSSRPRVLWAPGRNSQVRRAPGSRFTSRARRLPSLGSRLPGPQAASPSGLRFPGFRVPSRPFGFFPLLSLDFSGCRFAPLTARIPFMRMSEGSRPEMSSSGLLPQVCELRFWLMGSMALASKDGLLARNKHINGILAAKSSLRPLAFARCANFGESAIVALPSFCLRRPAGRRNFVSYASSRVFEVLAERVRSCGASRCGMAAVGEA